MCVCEKADLCASNVGQKRIQANLTEVNIEDLHEKRYGMYLEYLGASKHHSGLFNDIINEDEYDPLRWHDFDIGVKTADIVDPIQRDLVKVTKMGDGFGNGTES